jgi:hypothetical protein
VISTLQCHILLTGIWRVRIEDGICSVPLLGLHQKIFSPLKHAEHVIWLLLLGRVCPESVH